MKKNSKLQINIESLIMLIFISIILISDYFCLIFKNNNNYLLSIVIVAFIFFFIRRIIKIKAISFNKLDILFYLFILLFFLSRITIPDSSFDTLNYHLYMQEGFFNNNVSFNFFPSRWINTFSLPLGDRIHYFFRFLFGYRLGIFANLLFAIWIYYLIKRVLSHYIKNDKYISAISLVIIITEQILSNMITYYIDLMSIPLFLELFLIIIENKDVDNKQHFFTLFVAGIIFSLKVSNAFLLIPFAIVYIYKFRKSFNYKTFLFGIPLFFLPVLVYFINNYIQTGNPVFPFYNSIFKSKYLPETNWIENFYGPKRKIERLLWPIYIFFYPRRAYDTDIYYGRLSFGYAISIVYIIYELYKYFFKKEKIDNFLKLNILFVILCLLWSNFMMGYIRYALILEVLAGIIIAIFIYKFINSKNIILFLTSIIAIFGFARVTILATHDIIYGSTELSWRYSYYVDKEGYKENLKYLFQKNHGYNEYIEDIDCFGIVDYNSGYAIMLSNEKRIINLNEGYKNDYGKENFDGIINKCSSIYTISTKYSLERTEQYLESAGWKRAGEDIIFKTDFLSYYNDIVLYKIERNVGAE